MSQYHEMSKRKPSGGKANRAFKKKRSRIGSDPTLTVVAPKESKRTDRTRGANTKIRLKKGNTGTEGAGVFLVILISIFYIPFFQPKDWLILGDTEKLSGENLKKQLTASMRL